ncbi:MAG: HU family DNA-binding protein [Clostridia bacterium]|nr:HU family DNA-binding protein [Clostridia bacterium]
MTKAEFNAVVAEKLGVKAKDAGKAVDAVISAIQESVAKGEKVVFPGFGSFETRERAARKGRNPFTGESMHIEATKVPAFKVGKAFKEAVK